jgi:hypothetical protein
MIHLKAVYGAIHLASQNSWSLETCNRPHSYTAAYLSLAYL